MAFGLIDPRDEMPALRRASLLLERVREDTAGVDAELAALEAGIDAMRKAAWEGRLIPRTAVEDLEPILARATAASPSRVTSTVHQLIRRNALSETRDVLRRLRRRRASDARGSNMTGSARTPAQ